MQGYQHLWITKNSRRLTTEGWHGSFGHSPRSTRAEQRAHSSALPSSAPFPLLCTCHRPLPAFLATQQGKCSAVTQRGAPLPQVTERRVCGGRDAPAARRCRGSQGRAVPSNPPSSSWLTAPRPRASFGTCHSYRALKWFFGYYIKSKCQPSFWCEHIFVGYAVYSVRLAKKCGGIHFPMLLPTKRMTKINIQRRYF